MIQSKYAVLGLITFLLFLPIVSSMHLASDPTTQPIPVDPFVEAAYASIPAGSRVLMLPIFPVTWEPNIGNPYLPSSPIGYGILNYHEYLTEKYGLLSAFDLPSIWEVPIMNQWFMNSVNQMLEFGNVYGALNLLKECAGLEYLVVYKELVPSTILSDLDSAQSLKKTFDNPTMVVYRINDTAPYISATQNAVLLFSGSYADSLPALSNIGLGRLPIILGETPQGMFNLSGFASKENLIPVLMDTDIASIIDDYIARNNTGLINLGSSVASGWTSSQNWEPTIGGSTLASNTRGATFSQSFSERQSGNYTLLVRSVTNGQKSGNVTITLDGTVVPANIFPVGDYGARWFDLGTFYLTTGSHTIAFTSASSKWIDLDAVLVVPANQFVLEYDTYARELLGILAHSPFTEIYLASDSSTSLISSSDLSVMVGPLAQTLSGDHTGAGVLAVGPGGSASLLISVPIPSDYQIQARVSASVVLGANGATLRVASTPYTGGWNLESAAIYMGAGDQRVTLKNASNSTVYVDFVSAGTATLSSLWPQAIAVDTTGSNPEYVTVHLTSEPAYILVGVSYYPQWKVIPSENEVPYMANGFLTAFYVDDRNVELLVT